MLITSNEYNTANQLVATRSYAVPVTSSPSPLTFTLICYNSLGERNLTVEDMNRNNQIDWSDTDRIVLNDTRYVSLNGSWWRESSTWQTRQNGSSELTLMGRSRTRLTGLGDGLVSETRSIDPLGNETVACSYLDRATHTTTRTTLSPDSTLLAETVARCGLTVSTRTHTGVTTTYAYDAAGRLVKEGSKTYTYGYLDKVMSVTEGDKTYTYTYHADGQLASANYGDKTEDFGWDGLALIRRYG